MTVHAPTYEQALSLARAGLEPGRTAVGAAESEASSAVVRIERLDEAEPGVVRPTWRCFVDAGPQR
ncbi:hypothetical protein ACFWJ5_30740 [Streptomyces qaidamensis]|uniref:hypothetical protein n=1 Tax=Streptomyces qaidamensis TaxID=1783515 RepID=UPI00365A7169